MRADPRVGTQLAGHQILSVIGRGGMAVVYLAEHLRLRRKVALKVLDPEIAEDEDFRDRFIRESRIAAGLDHPNVVTVYDAGEWEGVLYISMRYVEGTDLERLLRAETRLQPSRALFIISQAASALDAAHAQGLVHRDVKPGNILLSAEPSPARQALGEHVYLSDFGVTKRMHSGSGLTRTGQFVGTVDYVAPEQIRGEEVDGRADVYSLGCVLYRCLTGSVPFPRETEVGTIYAHLQDVPARPTELVPELPSDLDEVISRALAKSRDDRFPACREFTQAAAGAVSSATDGAGVAVTEGGLAAAPPRVGVRRRFRLVWTLVVIGAGVVAAGVLALAVLRGSVLGRGGSSGPGPSEFPRLAWTKYPDVHNVLGGPRNQGLASLVTVGGSIVAVGYDDAGGERNAAAWTSPDGTRWRRTNTDQFADRGIQQIASAAILNGKVVGVGREKLGGDTDPAAWISADGGTSWHRVDSVTSGLHEVGNQLMNAVIEVSGELWAVGHIDTVGSQDAAVWTSRDGASWTRQTAPSFGGQGQEEMLGAAAFRQGLVVVGYGTAAGGDRDAAVWVESGGSWRPAPGDSLGGAGDQQMNSVVAGGPGLVAVGVDNAGGDDDAAVWTSTDGLTWVRVPADTATFGGSGDQRMSAVVALGSVLVAGGSTETASADENAAIWLSADGIHWHRQRPGSPSASQLTGFGRQRIDALALLPVASGARLVAVGTETQGQYEQGAAWWARVRPSPS